jgi:concanavalin A-like lectin/glucanase superfamily protein
MSLLFSKNTSNRFNLSANTGAINGILNGMPKMSVHCWINYATIDTASSDNVLLAAISNPGTATNMIYLNLDGTSGARASMSGRSVSTDSRQISLGTTKLTANTWYSIGGVIDFINKQVRVYVNGKCETVTSATFANSVYTGTNDGGSNYDTIGSGALSPLQSTYFNGMIDEFSIWSDDIGDDAFYRLASGDTPYTNTSLYRGLKFYMPMTGRYTKELDIRGGIEAVLTGSYPVAQDVSLLYPNAYPDELFTQFKSGLLRRTLNVRTGSRGVAA